MRLATFGNVTVNKLQQMGKEFEMNAPYSTYKIKQTYILNFYGGTYIWIFYILHMLGFGMMDITLPSIPRYIHHAHGKGF